MEPSPSDDPRLQRTIGFLRRVSQVSQSRACPPPPLGGLDDEHSEVHLRVVALRLEHVDHAQVGLVRPGVDHAAGRPVRAEWEASGSPFTAPGNRGGTVEHTLHKVLRFQEILVDRLGQRVRPARLGRPPSAVPGLPPPLEERRVRRVK